MRLPISLFIALILITAACNLPASNSQNNLTAIPTTAALSQPTRTPISTAEETEDAVESDTSTINTVNTASNTVSNDNSPASTTIICNKQTTWQAYIIEAGDTLFNIAQRGNTSVDTLVSANCLVDAGLISVGQVLYVPSAVAPRPTTDSGNTVPIPTADPNRYTTELWWIIQGDNGNTGFPVGCGDSIYLQQSGIPTNLSQEQTINRALAFLSDDNNIGTGQGDRGWWNPMSKSQLIMDSYSINGNHVTAYISGTLQLIGLCFDAQLQAQIPLNIMHLTGTRSATIYVNGQNIAHTFDMSGHFQKDSYTWEEFQNNQPLDYSNIVQFWVGIESNTVANTIQVGCGSYITPIISNSMRTDDTVDDLHEAFDALFDPNGKNPSTVYSNLLKDKNLDAYDITVEDGHAVVYIGPKLHGIGTCADPIIEGQIIQTIFQFEEINTAKVIINGDYNLRQMVDQSGDLSLVDYVYTRENSS